MAGFMVPPGLSVLAVNMTTGEVTTLAGSPPTTAVLRVRGLAAAEKLTFLIHNPNQ